MHDRWRPVTTLFSKKTSSQENRALKEPFSTSVTYPPKKTSVPKNKPGEDRTFTWGPPTGHTITSKAELYSYFQLRGEWAFRLLQIHNADPDEPLVCDLKVVHFGETDLPKKYIACSYTWGEPKFDGTVTVNGYSFSVTPHLEAALKRFRRCGWGWHWVDQICINQADLAERAQQVNIMGHIYSRSLWTFIWLGETDTAMEKAEPLIKHLAKAFEQIKGLDARFLPGLTAAQVEEVAKNICSPDAVRTLSYLHEGPAEDDEAWEAYYDLFRKDWWSRVWVQQEVALRGARRCLWFCGHNNATTDLEKLYRSTSALMFFDSVVQTHGPQITEHAHRIRLPSLTRSREEFGVYCMRYMYKVCDHDIPTFSQLLEIFRYTNCSDPRDRIYALRSLIRQGYRFPDPDYTQSVQSVYQSYAVYLMSSTARLEVLRRAGRSRQSLKGLPSWCPDWTTGPQFDLQDLGPRMSTLAYEAWPDFQRLVDYYQLPTVGRFKQGSSSHYFGGNFGTVGIDKAFTMVSAFGCVFDAVRDLGPWPDVTIRGGRALEWINRSQWLIDSFQMLQRTGSARDDATRYTVLCRILMFTEALREVPPPTSKQFRTAFGVSPEGPLEDCAAEYDLRYGSLREAVTNDATLNAREARLTEDFQTVVTQVIRDRRICVTERGYIGLVPAITMPGDRVCQFQNAGTPSIIRHDGPQSPFANNSKYFLIGNAYILELMDGEAFRNNYGLPEWIALT